MKKNQIVVLAGTALLLAATFLRAAEPVTATNKEPVKPTVKPGELFADPVIARGKGFEIMRSQLDDAFVALKANAAGRGQTITEDQRPVLESRMLNEMIFARILTNRATDADRTKAKEAAEKFVADARKQAASEESFNERLRLNKLTLPELEKKVASEALGGVVLDREIKSQITITDAQVKKFYDDNLPKFEQPEMVRASHILLGTREAGTEKELSDERKKAKRKEMEDLQKRARAGEDFGKLAKEFSEDPGSKDKGGEYTFPRGQMVPEFEAAAFSLSTNQVSDVVTTSYGYHIIKLSEKIPARVVPLSEASTRIKDELTRQEAQKVIPAYYEKLKKEAAVEILDEKLKESEKTALAPVGSVKPEKK